MKFRICGGLDAPDWILAEIVQLAKLSNVRFKLLSMQVIKHIHAEEIDYDKVDEVRGLDIAMVTTANTDEEARELLAGFGMPFMN